MVTQVFATIQKEVRGLHRAAYVLAIFTFGSQLLALVRDRLLAHEFGAGIELDIYYTAFRIPDVLYVLFASTLSVYVLIPFISERIQSASGTTARALLSQVFTLFIVVYTGIALLAIVFAPALVTAFFPGFGAHADTLVLLMRILLVQPLLLGISSLYGVVTQLEHRFMLYAIGPVIYNIGIIFGLLVLYPHVGLVGLVWGVLIGALGHLCIQVPFVRRTHLAPRLTRTFDISLIGRICRTSVARVLTLSLHQVVLLVLVGFASSMTSGSVSVFQFAFNLQSVPLAIIGVSYSVAAFPLLAQLYAEKRHTEFGTYVTNALKHILFWSIPVVVLFIVIRAQFVRVVLGSGSFDWNDTRLTAAILALFIVSLTAQAIHLLMVRALYAVGNTRIPFVVTLISSSCALVGAYVLHGAFTRGGEATQRLVSLMRLEDVTGTEVLALPIAYSAALIIHGIIMMIAARRHVFVSIRALVRPFLQSLGAGVGAGTAAYSMLNYLVTVFETDTLLTIFMQGAIAAFAGLLVYAVIQHLWKSEELNEVLHMGKRTFTRKTEVVAPQDEDHLAV